jgi:UDP-N-acetylglucosamine transferase subunit ALG13
MKEADLVVSHAGAGSVFEALGLGRPLLVVGGWLYSAAVESS